MEAFSNTMIPSHKSMDFDDDDKPVARGIWSELEHERFLEAMKAYPLGPWRTIADHVGTRSIKQVQTHAQKYQQKVARRQRGLRKQKKRVARPEHRVDQAAAGFIVRKPLTTDHIMAPSSPSSFEEMLHDATPTTPVRFCEEVDLAELLSAIEPLPFTLECAPGAFAMDADAHQRELHESLQFFLTSV
jgi:SHAQKYF class myb-like DNA-binding protein